MRDLSPSARSWLLLLLTTPTLSSGRLLSLRGGQYGQSPPQGGSVTTPPGFQQPPHTPPFTQHGPQLQYVHQFQPPPSQPGQQAGVTHGQGFVPPVYNEIVRIPTGADPRMRAEAMPKLLPAQASLAHQGSIRESPQGVSS